MNLKMNQISSTIIILLGLGYILFIGKSLFISLIFTLFIYILLKAAYTFFFKKCKSTFLSVFGCILSVIVFISILYIITSTQIEAFGEEIPRYKEVFSNMATYFETRFGISFDISSLLTKIDFQSIFSSFSTLASGFLGQVGTIAFLLIFLFIERGYLVRKTKKILSKTDHKIYQKISTKIHDDLSLYFGVKFAMACLNASISFVVMLLFGLEYALFFALLVFLFDFIPNIGAIIAMMLPFLFSFSVFDSALISFLLLGALLIPQTFTGNILEPKLIGTRLNLSGFFILISLLFWGSLWGIVGAFLAVPLMTSMNIVLSQFKKTQKIAIMLSEKGDI